MISGLGPNPATNCSQGHPEGLESTQGKDDAQVKEEEEKEIKL
jgi:hypothetical protein